MGAVLIDRGFRHELDEERTVTSGAGGIRMAFMFPNERVPD